MKKIAPQQHNQKIKLLKIKKKKSLLVIQRKGIYLCVRLILL